MVFTGWLEPLVDRIADNWSNVVTPVIGNINEDTLECRFQNIQDMQVGGFTWNLVFTWHLPPKEELANRRSIIAPMRYILFSHNDELIYKF